MRSSFSDLENKVCVITGGGGTLGSEIALHLASNLVKTVILDQDLKKADSTAGMVLEKTGVDSLGVEGDVLDRNSLINAKMAINQKFGPIQLLVNGAGGNSPKASTKIEFVDASNIKNLEESFYGLDIDGFREVFDLNFLGTVLPTMVFTTDMLKSGKGAVVNISSMNSFRPLSRIPAYSAAKASVNNFTSWLAVHLAKTGIRVNSIAPGFFLTNQNRFLLVNEETGELTSRGNRIISNTPMARFGVPSEVCGTVAFLLSDLAGFITGVTVPIDGGFNAYSGV